jgi:hypothetical protein
MYFREHAPPHFHVKYGEHKATVDIQQLVILEGKLPRRATGLVLEWAEMHRAALMRDWDLCQAMQAPEPIAPLE